MTGRSTAEDSDLAQALFLALRMPLDGIIPQIMSLPPHMLEAKPEDPLVAPGAPVSPPAIIWKQPIR